MGRKKLYTDEEKKQKLKEYQRKYYLKNKEILSKYKKDYYEEHADKYKARNKLIHYSKPLQIDGHSFVSPSSLHRVLVCPASATMCKDLPEEKSVYAEEGTAFHKLMEFNNFYYNELSFEDCYQAVCKLLSNNNFTETVLLELAENWRKTCKMVNDIKDNYNTAEGITIKEYKELNLPMYYNDKDSGTLDLGLVFMRGNHAKIVVVDYKYGKGVEVEAKNNPQLISYAISFIKYLKREFLELNIVEVKTCILQPRIDECYKEVKYTGQELSEQAKYINDGVKVVYDVYENGKDLYENSCVSEEGCRFCKAKGFCKKYNEEMTVLIGDIVDDVTNKSMLPEIRITDEEIKKIFEFEKIILPKIEDYIKMVKSSAEKRLLAGEKIEGLKLVKSVTRTKWIDNKDLIISKLQEVGVDAIDHAISLKPIGAIKKLLKKDDEVLKELTVLPEGKPQVVLDTDKREEYGVTFLDDINI